MNSIRLFSIAILFAIPTAIALSACGSESPSPPEGPAAVGHLKPQPGGSQCGGCRIIPPGQAEAAEAVDASAE
jgi:hypothetical protein